MTQRFTSERRDASEQVAFEIRRYVSARGLRPGERLGTEQELAAEFGVSRPTLREGLRLLAGSHLVRAAQGPGGGIFVDSTQNEGMGRNLSESIATMLETDSVSLHELLDARVYLEVPLAGLAAQNATEQDSGGAPGGDRRSRGEPSRRGGVPDRRRALPPRDRGDRAERAAARVHELDARRAAAVADRHDRRARSTEPRSCASTARSSARSGCTSLRPPSARCGGISSTCASSSTRSTKERHESGTHARVSPAARARRPAGARALRADGRARPDRRGGRLRHRPARDRGADGARRRHAAARPRPRERRLGGGDRRRRDDGREGRRGARVPAVQLRPLRRLPSRQRHALRAPRVHGPVGRRRLRRLRARLGALAPAAARRRRAGGGRAAFGRGADRLPRGATPGAARLARHDRRRDRGRRCRPHRAPAPPRARLELDDRRRHRLAAPPARGGARRRRRARRAAARSTLSAS